MPYALLGSFVFASALMLHPAAHAEGGPARASMERCVERVLSGLAKAKAPESEVRMPFYLDATVLSELPSLRR